MERLTYKASSDGAIHLIPREDITIDGVAEKLIQDAIEKLYAYEQTGFTPEEIELSRRYFC